MELLLFYVAFVSTINFILLIGVAGAVVRFMKTKEKKSSFMNITRQKRFVDVEGRTPNYAEVGMINAALPEGISDAPVNWDGLPRNKRNWDGLPSEE